MARWDALQTWDVEAELQKELDALSVASHISSSSSSAGFEEAVRLEDADRSSNNPLNKLLDDWRAKEKKLESFESMLNRIRTWETDVVEEVTEKDQKITSGSSNSPAVVGNAVKDTHSSPEHVLQRLECQTGDGSLSWIGLSPNSGNSGGSSSCFPHPDEVSSFNILGPGENFPNELAVDKQLLHERLMQSSLPGPDKMEGTDTNLVEKGLSQEQKIDFHCCSDVYEDGLSMLRARRTRMLEDYRVAEEQRLLEKDLRRQMETQESRKRMLLVAERRQELEEQIRKENMDKLALLESENTVKKLFLEELQRTEAWDLEMQTAQMEQSHRTLMDSVVSYKHKEEELELGRLEQGRTPNLDGDQENTFGEILQTTPDTHLIRCSVLIQAWIRGFICRKIYHGLKCKTAEEDAIVSLHNRSEEAVKSYGQEESDCKAHQAVRSISMSDEQIKVTQRPEDPVSEAVTALFSLPEDKEDIHGQQSEMCELGEDAFSQGTTCRSNQLFEEVLGRLGDLAESGTMQEFNSCLGLATALGLTSEARATEEQLNQMKGRVEVWLKQVIHGWETKKINIQKELQEARRLELVPVYTVAEAVMLAREKEIIDNLEASILKASRCDYNYWMSKAKIFGMEEIMEIYSKSFQKRLKTVRYSLKREAKIGAKDVYSILFQDANSLGLQSDVGVAVKLLLKRVLRLIKRVIVLAGISSTEHDARVPAWKAVEVEGAEIGLDSQALADLRWAICEGRSLDFVKEVYVTCFTTNDTGGPLKILHKKYGSVGLVKPVCHEASMVDASELHVTFDRSNESSRLTIASLSASPCVVAPKLPIWSVPHNWLEMHNLQRYWQQHMICLQRRGNDDSNVPGYRAEYVKLDEGNLHSSNVSHTTGECTLYYPSSTLANHLKEGFEIEGIQENQVVTLNSDKDQREEKDENSAGFSDNEDEPGRDTNTQVTELLQQQQKGTPSKSSLTREMLEGTLNCSKKELRWVTRLELTDRHLESIRRADLCRWCPRLKSVTIDMNNLTTLKGVFDGGEDNLEYLSVRNNLLVDMVGLECLHRLTVLHLDGNSLSHLAFGLPSCSLNSSKESRKVDRFFNLDGSFKFMESHCKRPVLQSCWPRLQILTVGCNRLTDVSKVGTLCPSLESLDLRSNQLVSLEVAEQNALAGLHHLRFLDVGQNRLKDRSLWKGLEHCPKLVSLVASRNKLRELPKHLGNVLLREIWLNGNAIKRLTCTAWLPSLQRLYLQDNMIDALEPLWGCPALEVLDLSFNSISQISDLRHLSCFPCLRSLQLNDNPVSEQDDHVDYVLQAVPWLAELDNEAVAKVSRDKAVTSIFKRIMDVIGLEFFRQKILRGETVLTRCANPFSLHRVPLHSTEQAEGATGKFLQAQEVNAILNGEADEAFLWEILIEVKHLAASSSVMKSLLTMNVDLLKFEGLRPFSESELEARSNMIAYNQMAAGLKGKLHAATKDRCLERVFKDAGLTQQNPLLLEGMRAIIPFLGFSSEAPLSSNKGDGSNLKFCLEEHITFDSYSCREVYSENRGYTSQVQAQVRRVTRLQALLRGFLARIQVRLLRGQKMAMLEAATFRQQEHRYICKIQARWKGWKARQAKLQYSAALKIQAHWKGWKVRQAKLQYSAALKIQAHWKGFNTRVRLRQALKAAKYLDNDDFDYVHIDNSEFLVGEVTLAKVYERCKTVLPALDEGDAVNIPQQSSAPECKSCLQFASHNGRVKTNAEFAEGVVDIQLTYPFEFGTECVKEAVSLAPRDGAHDHLGAFSDNGDVTDLVSERLEQHEGNEEKIGTALLDSISFKSKLNMDAKDLVSQTLGFLNNDVLRKVEGSLEQDLQSSPATEDEIIADGKGDDPSMPSATEVKRKGALEEIAKDWGFKSKTTVQALIKAREKTKMQAKSAANKNLLRGIGSIVDLELDRPQSNSRLQDPDLRLRRFRERLGGHPVAMGTPIRRFEQRVSFGSTSHPATSVNEQRFCGTVEPGKSRNIHMHGVHSMGSHPEVPSLMRVQKKNCTSAGNREDVDKVPLFLPLFAYLEAQWACWISIKFV